MSRGSVSVDVRDGVSIDVGWTMSVDGRCVSLLDGGERVSVDGTSVWHQTQGLQPPEHLSSDLLHYADDLPGHAGLLSHLVQVSKSQPCLEAQCRSMSGMEYRSMSDGRCRSMEDECLRSTVVSEYRSMGLVSGSTVVERNERQIGVVVDR
ncbi:hypothetical protein DY000_02006778 [Brassica cretica]|uniref:Uncharacterized protein n=1 Tax=Brassica cretica TaxID=69181 RepID=A0ABQ7CGC8_BRACR|nr:hypothetical protein DY000_02006778 [Brassica cretica]